jgi:hypothetical protein
MTEPAPPSGRSPVRRAPLILVALCLVVAACSDDDDQAETVPARDTTTTAGDASEDTKSSADPALEEVVVQLDDLPSGYTATPPDDDPADDSGFCGDEDVLTKSLEEAPASAESNFKQSDFGPFVASFAARYDDSDTAEEFVDRFAHEAAGCGEFTETDEDGATVTYRFEPLSFPKVGDQTFATRLTGTTVLGALVLDIAVARVDDTAVGVVNGGFATADTALTEELMRTMTDRV